MSDKPIEEKVKDIIVEQLGVNPEQVTPTPPSSKTRGGLPRYRRAGDGL